MGEREFEILGKELLDVGALDVVGLFDFDNFENLKFSLLAVITAYDR